MLNAFLLDQLIEYFKLLNSIRNISEYLKININTSNEPILLDSDIDPSFQIRFPPKLSDIDKGVTFTIRAIAC